MTTPAATNKVTKTISILGSGWLGLPLGLAFLSQAYSVKTSTTHQERIEELQKKQLKPHIVDIDKTSAQLKNFLQSDILIVNITSKSIDGFTDLISHIEASTIQHVLFVSSTSVYPFNNAIVHEHGAKPSHPLAQIETLFLNNTHFSTSILRLAGTFGYSRHPGRFFKSGKKVRNPDSPVNLIHRDDCINIILNIVKQEAWKEVFNGVADDHPSKREFYSRAAKNANMPALNFEETDEAQIFKIVSNDYLKQRLGYSFIHPTLADLDFKTV